MLRRGRRSSPVMGERVGERRALRHLLADVGSTTSSPGVPPAHESVRHEASGMPDRSIVPAEREHHDLSRWRFCRKAGRALPDPTVSATGARARDVHVHRAELEPRLRAESGVEDPARRARRRRTPCIGRPAWFSARQHRAARGDPRRSGSWRWEASRFRHQHNVRRCSLRRSGFLMRDSSRSRIRTCPAGVTRSTSFAGLMPCRTLCARVHAQRAAAARDRRLLDVAADARSITCSLPPRRRRIS